MNVRTFKRRIYVSAFLILTVTVLFLIKLFSIHFSSKIKLPPPKKPRVKRGAILDRKDYRLAVSVEALSLYANPQKITSSRRTAEVLAPLLDVSVGRLQKRLERNKKFVWLKRKLDRDVSDRIKKLEIPGLGFKAEYKRLYPHGSLGGNLIGFTGVDNVGLEGIEYLYNSVLEETDGEEQGWDGIAEGRSIQLTIDRAIQYLAERVIEGKVTGYKAKQGAILIMEVKTGRVLALAKYPRVDPNIYRYYTAFERRNFTVIDSFEPGSTMKVITAAALLEHTPSVLKKEFLCKGETEIADVTIKCTHTHGMLDLKGIICHSCNIGIIKAMAGMKKVPYYGTLTRFGFGEQTCIELPGESEGILRGPKTWSGLSKYSISIGHEISVTSLQLAGAICAIANGGIYFKPSIIRSIQDSRGNIIKDFPPVKKGRVTTAAVADRLISMMESVVKKGTGRGAAVKGFRVAGKTGTSEKFSKKGGTYSDRVIASFVGIVPVENPEICVYVVIDDPAGRESGGRIAAPTFSEIVTKVLPLINITGEKKGAGLPLPLGAAGHVKGDRMPDMRGLSLFTALSYCVDMKKKKGVTCTFSGTGKVYSQKPEGGTSLKKGQKVFIYLKE